MAVGFEPHLAWGQNRILRPSAVAETQTWTDYANGVLDSLLAVDFRGAASLAAATLYGSTPSVIQEPVGGLNLTATGLVCDNDTRLDTGITIDSSSGYVMFVRFSNGRVTSNSAPIGSTGDNGTFFYNFRVGGIVRALWLGSENLSVPSMSEGSLGFIDGRYYADGVHIITLPGIGSPAQQTIKIGTRGDTSVYFGGNIEAVCIGTLKAGQDADTVASELHSRMQTPVITLWYLANGAIDSGNVVYHGENVAAGTKYDGTTLTGDWTWAAKFDAVQPASNTAIMDSSTNSAKDYWLRHNSIGAAITLLAPDGVVNGIMADGKRVMFLVVDESGGTAKVYVDNSEVASITTVNPGEFLGGGVGDLWASTMYTTADYLSLIDEALDPTQRAALYAAMTA